MALRGRTGPNRVAPPKRLAAGALAQCAMAAHIWVECAECSKWRRVPPLSDEGARWRCADNADARFASFFGEEKYLKAMRLFLTQESDPEYRKFTRNTKAESDGRFTFENVAPGTYYLWTQATWYADNAILPSGGLIYEKVTVKGDETEPVKVIVSGK